MDKETERQALEAFLDKYPGFRGAHNIETERRWKTWLAAWEARGRASGRQVVEWCRLVVVDPEDHVWEDAAFNLSSRFGPEFVEPLGEFAKAFWLEMMTLAASPQITSHAEKPREQEVVGFLVTSGEMGYSIVKRAAEPTSDYAMAMWLGKPVNELTRDELLEALSWCCRDNVELRDDRDKWRNAGDLKKYLLQK